MDPWRPSIFGSQLPIDPVQDVGGLSKCGFVFGLGGRPGMSFSTLAGQTGADFAWGDRIDVTDERWGPDWLGGPTYRSA